MQLCAECKHIRMMPGDDRVDPQIEVRYWCEVGHWEFLGVIGIHPGLPTANDCADYEVLHAAG